MALRRVHLDANIILRFVLADHPKQSPKARMLFERAETGGDIVLFVSHLSLAEVSWVLTSFYDFGKSEVAEKLQGLLMHVGVVSENLELLLTACASYGKLNIDFADCYHATFAEAEGSRLATFDRDFRKFPNLELEEL